MAAIELINGDKDTLYVLWTGIHSRPPEQWNSGTEEDALHWMFALSQVIYTITHGEALHAKQSKQFIATQKAFVNFQAKFKSLQTTTVYEYINQLDGEQPDRLATVEDAISVIDVFISDYTDVLKKAAESKPGHINPLKGVTSHVKITADKGAKILGPGTKVYKSSIARIIEHVVVSAGLEQPGNNGEVMERARSYLKDIPLEK